jgi:hypothetical protein
MNSLPVSRIAVSGLVALAAVSTSAWAQDKKAAGPNSGPKSQTVSPSAAAVADVAMARQLARLGEQRKDPVLLIAAARVLQESAGKVTSPEKPESSTGEGAGTKQAADASAAAMLASAKKLAAGRADLIALADETAAAGTRGAVGGGKVGQTVVRSRGVDAYSVTFRGGEQAVVAISGDGDSDLDLEVYDENGGLICRANGASDDEVCRWTPRWTGPFRIRVVNMGVANRYVIGHN